MDDLGPEEPSAEHVITKRELRKTSRWGDVKLLVVALPVAFGAVDQMTSRAEKKAEEHVAPVERRVEEVQGALGRHVEEEAAYRVRANEDFASFREEQRASNQRQEKMLRRLASNRHGGVDDER